MRLRTAGWRIAALSILAALLADAANAACTVPNTLTNGQTADAGQVMANFNAVAGCVNSQPAGATNSVQINAGAGLLGPVGPLTNGQLLIGSTANPPQAANLTAGVGITITNGPGTITIAASGVSGISVGAPQGRLTLTSGSPVMSADVVAATTVYYDCYAGKSVPYFTGVTDAAASITGCEVSTALQASGTGALNGGDVFDVFWAQGASAICVATNGSSAGWSGDAGGSLTTRGTGYSQVHNTRGYWTNANAIAHCYNGATDEGPISADQATYLGSLFTTAAGTTRQVMRPAAASGGGNPCLCLFNAYNQVRTTASSVESATWNYTTNAWREMNNSAADRVTWLDGLGALAPTATYFLKDYESTSGFLHSYQALEDGTSLSGTAVCTTSVYDNCVTFSTPTSSFGTVVPGGGQTSPAPKIGLHFEQMMELNNGGGSWTQNVDGHDNLTLVIQD